MRAGGQNRGAHQRERSIVSGFAPVLPRLVSRPLTDAEDSLIPGAPDASTHDGDGYNSCAFEEGSPLHEAPPQTFSPSRPLPRWIFWFGFLSGCHRCVFHSSGCSAFHLSRACSKARV